MTLQPTDINKVENIYAKNMWTSGIPERAQWHCKEI